MSSFACLASIQNRSSQINRFSKTKQPYQRWSFSTVRPQTITLDKANVFTDQVAATTLAENQSLGPFQHWDDILETIHRSSVYRLLSSDLEVEFQLTVYHRHASSEDPLVLTVTVSAIHVSTAGKVLKLLQKSFHKEIFNRIQRDINTGPFHFILQEEESPNFKLVIAKHSTLLVRKWFDRNVRFGQRKFFKMAIEMKFYEGGGGLDGRRHDCEEVVRGIGAGQDQE